MSTDDETRDRDHTERSPAPELPDVDPHSAPPIELPPDPLTPIFDREARTVPPGPDDDLFEDPEAQDPMLHAPPWGKDLHRRFTELRDLVWRALDPEGGIPALRAGLLADFKMAAQNLVDEFFARDQVRKKEIEALGETQQELAVRVTKLEHYVADELAGIDRRVTDLEQARALISK